MADILMVTAIAGAEECAAVLSGQFQLNVEIAANRKEAVALLKRREYRLVVIDESMIEAGEDGSDMLVRHCGAAMPLEINFAISGCGRLVRAVRAALSRREQENEVASRAATALLQCQLREIVAGLLLHAELAASDPEVPAAAAARLRVVVELAGTLRRRLDISPPALPHALSPMTDPSRIPAPVRVSRPVIVPGHATDGAQRRRLPAAHAGSTPAALQPMA